MGGTRRESEGKPRPAAFSRDNMGNCPYWRSSQSRMITNQNCAYRSRVTSRPRRGNATARPPVRMPDGPSSRRRHGRTILGRRRAASRGGGSWRGRTSRWRRRRIAAASTDRTRRSRRHHPRLDSTRRRGCSRRLPPRRHRHGLPRQLDGPPRVCGGRPRAARQQPGQVVPGLGVVGLAPHRRGVARAELAPGLLRPRVPARGLDHLQQECLVIGQADRISLRGRVIVDQPLLQRDQLPEAVQGLRHPALSGTAGPGRRGAVFRSTRSSGSAPVPARIDSYKAMERR